MARSGYRKWTTEETSYLCDTIDLLANANVSSLSRFARDVYYHFQKESAGSHSSFLETQILNKIHHMARPPNVTAVMMLRQWTVYGPHAKSSSGYKTGHTLDSTLAVQLNDPGFVKQDETMSHNSELSTPPAPSTSFDDTTEITQSHGEPVAPSQINTIHLAEWEKQLVLRLREHVATTGYHDPPSRDGIKSILRNIMEGIDDSFECFVTSSSRTSILNLESFTDNTLELASALANTADRDEVRLRLHTLATSPNVSPRALYGAITAAAVHKWAFHQIEEYVQHIGSPACVQCTVLKFVEDYEPHIAQNIKVARVNAYIEATLQPLLPGFASKIRMRIYEALLSLFVPVAGGSQDENSNFRSRQDKLREWERLVDGAVLEALKMIVTMAKCCLSYRFRFPWIGHKFQESWMEEAYISAGDLTKPNIVYLCLRPAVFSQGNSNGAIHDVVVSHALVVAERLAADATSEVAFTDEGDDQRDTDFTVTEGSNEVTSTVGSLG